MRIPRSTDQATAQALIKCQSRFLRALITKVEKFLLMETWEEKYGFTEKDHHDALVSVVQSVGNNNRNVTSEPTAEAKDSWYDGRRLGNKKLSDFLPPLAKMKPLLPADIIAQNDELRKDCFYTCCTEEHVQKVNILSSNKSGKRFGKQQSWKEEKEKEETFYQRSQSTLDNCFFVATKKQ